MGWRGECEYKGWITGGGRSYRGGRSNRWGGVTDGGGVTAGVGGVTVEVAGLFTHFIYPPRMGVEHRKTDTREKGTIQRIHETNTPQLPRQ